MDKANILNGALRAAAFAVKHKQPTVEDTLPTVDDLVAQDRLGGLFGKFRLEGNTAIEGN